MARPQQTRSGSRHRPVRINNRDTLDQLNSFLRDKDPTWVDRDTYFSRQHPPQPSPEDPSHENEQ